MNESQKKVGSTPELGILLRGYAKKEEQVEDVVRRLYASAMQAYDLAFKSIAILIPREKDCGKTHLALAKKLPSRVKGIAQIVSSKGDAESDALNEGLACLRKHQCTHAFIMSNKALGYLTIGNMAKILGSIIDGALVSELAVRDLSVPEEEDRVYRGILEGRIANVCAVWNLAALNQVGDFDSKIGVEGIAPIVRLCRKFQSWFIAPIIPVGQEGVNVSSLRASRQAYVMSTKESRQLAEAERAGGSFKLIRACILPGYPK